MRIAALFSGGKDSVYSAKLAEEMGHNVDFLVSLRSSNPDSYMFHTINQHLTLLQAEAMGKTIIVSFTPGIKEEELVNLETVLSGLKIEGIVTGAISSNYQKTRVDRICERLDILHISPLWGRERIPIIEEMLEKGMDIIISAVAAQGLDKSWLGKKLDYNAIGELKLLNEKFGIDVCGEGGEYESLVLDAPWFGKPMKILKASLSWDGMSGRFLVEEAKLGVKLHKI
jgi:ABC transporter with metal-binding/Fe-S-binding domain ATP-binding protein